MSAFLLYLSSVLVKVAQTPYLDGYFFATVWGVVTFAGVAFVIDFVYSFKGNN
jgi:hypothetical protein